MIWKQLQNPPEPQALVRTVVPTPSGDLCPSQTVQRISVSSCAMTGPQQMSREHWMKIKTDLRERQRDEFMGARMSLSGRVQAVNKKRLALC